MSADVPTGSGVAPAPLRWASPAANDPAASPLPDQAKRLIALAVTQLECGDARNALVAASEACHRASHLPQAHYVYGQAWLGALMRISGETEAAESLLRATIARAPGNAAVDDRRGVATSPDHASAPSPRNSR